MGLIDRIKAIFQPQPPIPVPLVCAFEVTIGRTTYKAQSACLQECKNTVLETIPKIKTAPIDYIQ